MSSIFMPESPLEIPFDVSREFTPKYCSNGNIGRGDGLPNIRILESLPGYSVIMLGAERVKFRMLMVRNMKDKLTSKLCQCSYLLILKSAAWRDGLADLRL